MANPFDQFDTPTAQSPSRGPVYGPPPLPPKPETPGEQIRTRIAQTKEARDAEEYNATHINGRPIPTPKQGEMLGEATSSMQGAVAKIDNQIKRIDELYNHPGLDTIVGPIDGRLPTGLNTAIGTVTHLFGATAKGTDSEAAQALIDQLGSAATIAELQDMRANSKTGGAVGNVSNYEDQMLRNAAARLSQTQSQDDFRKSLIDYKTELEAAKRRLQQAYVTDYGGQVPQMNGGQLARPAARPPNIIRYDAQGNRLP